MNMIAATDISAATRVDLRDLDDMPVDMVALTAAMRDLSARELGIWLKLRAHFWMYGSLPAGLRALAKIGGTGPTAFERIAPALGRHFDRTDAGAWCDHRLARARGKRIVVPSRELPPVDPSLREKRQASGSLGGQASGARRRALAAGPGDPLANSPDPAVLLRSEANSQANGEANPGAAAADFACSGEASASLAPGWLVGSNPRGSSKTNQPTAGVDEANGPPDEANGPAPDEANRGEANDPAARPSEPGDDRDARMAKAIRDACPGKIAAATAGWGVKTIKTWIAKGCSFEDDYLPTLKTFAATNKEVRNVANELIEAATFRARDERLAGASGGRAATRPDLSAASAETRALHAGFEGQVAPEVYLSWGCRLEMLEIADGTARIGVPSRFVKTWLEGKFARELEAAARAVRADVARVVVEVRPGPG